MVPVLQQYMIRGRGEGITPKVEQTLSSLHIQPPNSIYFVSSLLAVFASFRPACMSPVHSYIVNMPQYNIMSSVFVS